MKTPERPLNDYVAEISERTEVRMGVPLPMGTHEYRVRGNFAFFSRVRLELFDLPADGTPDMRPLSIARICDGLGIS